MGEKFIGAHVSIAGGVFNAPLNAKAIGANAMAMFTKNQRQWISSPLSEKDINLFKFNLAQAKIKPEHVLVHDSYLINLGNADIEKRKTSINSFIHEFKNVNDLGLKLLNFHPGSHVNLSTQDECIKLIAEGVNKAIREVPNVVAVIETTAGQGTNIGRTFEEIASIIEKIDDKSRVGVCIDTCHIFAAGYDIRDDKSYDTTMSTFDKIVGFNYLKGMHLNDAKSEFSSRVDRHESLGKGNIGLALFRKIMQDERFDNMPLILETIDETIWEKEIELLRSYNI